PSLLSSCRNASTSTAMPEGVLGSRKPMRKTFPGCCALMDEQSARSRAQSAKLNTLNLLLLPIARCLLPLFICSLRPLRLVERINEPCFFQFVDKTQIDKILYLGFVGLRIKRRLNL